MSAAPSTWVWITNDTLTPEHDHKILREALGTHMGSGWRLRDDQSDPVEVFSDVSEIAPESTAPAAGEPTSKPAPGRRSPKES